MRPEIDDAIRSLAPRTAFSIDNNAIVAWDMSEVKTNITQPTDAEIATELTRLQAAYDAQAYARSRKAAYDLLNQFEMQFDDAANGTTTWIDAINAIKQEFPK
jgi:hypothetical protein